MGVLAGDDRLRDAHERASRVGLKELEKFAARQTNTATTRGSELTGNICGAAFTHDASRALDPQLHTHFVLANATQTESGNGLPSMKTECLRRCGMPERSIRTSWPAR